MIAGSAPASLTRRRNPACHARARSPQPRLRAAHRAPIDLARVVSVHDFEAPARERLDPAAWAYYAGGAWDGHTLRANERDWDRYSLVPRVLVDVSATTLETAILGRPAALPFGVAPAALHGLAHPEGELATARAAAAAGAINVVSTVASRSIEAIAAAAPDARRWFQLYVQKDWGLTRSLVERAAAAGYEALVLTVDAPVLGYRDDILRLHLRSRRGRLREPAQARRVAPRGRAGRDPRHARRAADLGHARGDPRLGAAAARRQGDPHRRGRRPRGGPRRRRGVGVEPRRAPAGPLAGGASRCSRRSWTRSRAARRSTSTAGSGADVLVALALGATAVFTARPLLYALACAGEAGVARALAILRDETERALAIAGAAHPSGMGRDHVRVSGAVCT